MAAKVASTTAEVIKSCLTLASDVLRLPERRMWIDYDEEADVLYVSFRRPQRATKTIDLDNGILVRKDGRRIVGVTILDASTR